MRRRSTFGFVALCVVSFALAGLLLLLPACSSDDTPADTCTSNADCPEEAPFCVDGQCTDGEVAGCEAHTDCPADEYCNELTGECIPGPRPCENDEDCPAGQECGAEGLCVEEGENGNGDGDPCEDAHDCEPEQVCVDGTCEPYDPSLACHNDDECPADHVCNYGDCEGCLNDAFCVDSPNGPRCAVDDSAPVPVGYCYKECGADVERDCPVGYICDEERGGLCVEACDVNEDCEGGYVCVAGMCEPCEDSAQCTPPEICDENQGICVEPQTGCTQADCEQNLGMAYYCDPTTGQCLRGCTDHTPEDCETLDLDENDCSPCPDGETCDMDTRQCSGSEGCDCAALDCGSDGQVCDAVICECVDPSMPGNGNGGSDGDECWTNDECSGGTECFGAMAELGVPGTCHYVCDMNTMCVCADSSMSCDLIDIAACMFGLKGKCE